MITDILIQVALFVAVLVPVVYVTMKFARRRHAVPAYPRHASRSAQVGGDMHAATQGHRDGGGQ